MQDTILTTTLLETGIVQSFQNRLRETRQVLGVMYDHLVVNIEAIRTARIKSKPYLQMGVAYELFLKNIQDYLVKLDNWEVDFLRQMGVDLDMTDDPEQIEHDLKKLVDHYERTYLLELLEILDAIERLDTRWRNTQHVRPGRLAHRICSTIQATLQSFQENIQEYLETQYEIRRMTSDDLIGTYPPLDTTRIVFREDRNTSDDFVVSRIICHAYSRKGRLFRKASVGVITRGANQ